MKLLRVGTILDGMFKIGIIWVGIVRMVILLGENFPGGKCPGGSYPVSEFSRWELFGVNHLSRAFPEQSLLSEN